MFPLKDSADQELEDIKSIVDCFRKLQGDTSSTDEFERFKKRLEYEQGVVGPRIIPESSEAVWREKSLTYSSQLERLIVLDPFESFPAPRFPQAFAENPFSFTLPLGLKKYNNLYGEATGIQRTRRRLAERIVQRLLQSPKENVAIVGAHRAGKTTLLKLVYDLLTERLAKSDSRVILIPIWINASVTPPHMLFIALLEEMYRLKGRVKKLAHSFGRSLKRILEFAQSITVKVEVKPVSIELPDIQSLLPEKDATHVDERVRSLLVRLEEDKKEVLPVLLSMALQALRDALKSDENLRLVVVMDEFSESTAWGDLRTLAVWRHAIESDDFSRINWLFSTTRPVEEAVEYSPITNIFMELNVGSLSEEESQGLIDAFSVNAWKKDPIREEKLRPIITHPARIFLIKATSSLPYLLQVSCYHIYDRATRSSFPLINKELCRKTILGKVLLEMADYLERQWSKIPEGARQFIIDTLPKDLNPDEFLRLFTDRWEVDLALMPPGSLKALERSGLRGDDGRCVAPLVAAWLLSSRME
jgi:hypothetical protein